MTRKVRGSRSGPWGWFLAIVVLSALVGFFNAEAPKSQSSTTLPEAADPTVIEQIESTLAQAGCPGWIVLASEGETALQPPSKIVPSEVQQTALRVTSSVPTVSYPTPVRVASRLLFEASTTAAQPTVGAADAPDDLLDGVPDLLAAPDNKSQPSPPASLPADSQPSESKPSLPPAKEAQAPTPQPVAEPADATRVPLQKSKTQAVPHPTPAQPQPAEQPVFPGPMLPSERIQAAPKLPPVTAPKVQPETVPFSPPSQSEQIDLPAPIRLPVPVQPTLPTQEKRPVPQTPRVAPVEQPPKQSPFAPPPKPANPSQSTPHSVDANSTKDAVKKPAGEPKSYCEFVAESQYPSAQACAKCHEKIFDEWSVSSHAYAAVSPMYHKFEQRINDLSQGTIGYFCYRCHTPVGVSMGVSRATPVWDIPLSAREGVTCIVCHRVNQRYGKVNGERRIEPGSIFDPVYGPIGGAGVAEVIAGKSKYKVKTSPHEKGPGQDIHNAGLPFDQLSKAEFCVSCHQVAVDPGIKLEVVWEQYRASPACKKGVSCQDCHMGRIPGVASGYEVGEAAKISGKSVSSKRRHANHTFYGPGYSIAHPGVFPFNPDANRWSMQEWLQFDWRAGWGTEEFEEALDAGEIYVSFPPVWQEADDRYDAREVIDDNLKKLDAKDISRHQLMENGSHVDGPFFDTQLVRGQNLKFHYVMTNANEGHNLPSGSLGAQPQLWANVALIGPHGRRLWESGYTDRWGDVADIHSVGVRNKEIPFDSQLFNLQTMFLTTGAKGTDREFYLPVNFDFDQLPYLRPGAQPNSVLNHPPFIRMEGRSLPPLGSRRIPYKVPAHLMQEPGHYRLTFRLRSRLEPIYFMRFCGATEEMIRGMNEGMLNFHQSSVEFFVR